MIDQGFQNTAVTGPEISYVDGIEGSIHYRNHSIADLVGKKRFEDFTVVLIWGHLTSTEERDKYRKDLVENIYQDNMTLVDIQIVRVLSALGTVVSIVLLRLHEACFYTCRSP